MPERTTVRLPEELLTQAKRKAFEEGRTLTSLIEDGLRLVLRPSRGGRGREPVCMPRISTASGGLLPGIDLNDSSAVQEMEDLEYAQRLRRL